jgi:hypothetical protein
MVKYLAGFIIFWLILRYLYHVLFVKNYSDLRAHAVEASIFIVDKVIFDFTSNKNVKTNDLSAQDTINIAYEISALCYAFLLRYIAYSLDSRQAKYTSKKLEKYIKGRLQLNNAGSIKYPYTVAALNYAKEFIATRFISEHDGLIRIQIKYALDPDSNDYKVIESYYSKVMDECYEKYQQPLNSLTTLK